MSTRDIIANSLKAGDPPTYERQLIQDKIRRGVKNFLDRRISEGALEALYGQLNAHGKTGMILQVMKYEMAYTATEMELEKTMIQRLPDDQLEELYERLKQKQEPIKITYENEYKDEEAEGE